MSSKLILPIKIIAQTGKTPTGAVIFLHGSGDTGRGLYEWLVHLCGEFSFPHLRVLLPSAPPRPYKAIGGVMSNVWFDRREISKFVEEDIESIDFMSHQIVDLIKKEVESGIPLNRIVIGGFSMGGALSFHVGYRFLPELAGVFALSAFINDNSAIYEHLSKKTDVHLPALYQSHGARDELVPLAWGEESFKNLQKFGVQGQFCIEENTFHELKKKCLMKLQSWINEIVPDNV